MKLKEVITLIAAAVILYCVVAQVVYRFRHPEQTETQLLLNTFDVLLWKSR